MRTRSERRWLRDKAIMRRRCILDYSGKRMGTIYERHINKVDKSTGYMSKHGTLLHYARGTHRSLGKVRDRKSWTGTTNWKPRDIRQIDSMTLMLNENQL